MAFEKLTAYLDSLGEKKDIPARDFMITVNGECVYRHFAGCRDAAGKVPMNGCETYWIYSMTKPLTCACALKLIEEGRLSLDDKVSKYIPAFAIHPDMTVEHLFGMRGGLDYDLDTPALRARGKDEGTFEIVSRIADRELHFKPGADFLYSLAHDVLGGIVEVVSGMKFDEYMKKLIWEPFGMSDTSFTLTDRHRADMCAQYERPDGVVNKEISDFENIYVLTPNYRSGGAGVITTTEDYSKFVTAVVCGKLLAPETIELWRGRTLTGKARKSYEALGRAAYNYALGVQVIVDDSAVSAPKGVYGWDGAAGAACFMDPDNKVAMVYMQHVKNCGDVYTVVHPTIRDLAYDALREARLI